MRKNKNDPPEILIFKTVASGHEKSPIEPQNRDHEKFHQRPKKAPREHQKVPRSSENNQFNLEKAHLDIDFWKFDRQKKN